MKYGLCGNITVQEKGILVMDYDFQIKKEAIEKYLNNLNISKNLVRKDFEEFFNELNLDPKQGRSAYLTKIENGPSDHITAENVSKWFRIVNFGTSCFTEYERAVEYISNTISANHTTSPSIELKSDGVYQFTDEKIKELKAEVEKDLSDFNVHNEELYASSLKLFTRHALEAEMKKLSTYTPGVCILIIQMLLEKFLKDAVEFVKENKLGILNPSIVFSSSSEIDNSLEYLQKTIDLDYTKNFTLKGAIFKLRNARNAFAHGSWDNLYMSLNQIKISDILEQLDILQTSVLIKMFRCADP